MSRFGETMRLLMEAKGVSGIQLAEDIGITPTSVSRVLNGQSRPRQVTLTRIMKRLCESKQEEQALLRAYSGLEDQIPAEPIIRDKRNADEERERCERFLEIKTQSIAFKNSVARELSRAGIEFQRDYCEGIYSTDFLIERNGKRIALECKFNVHRDLEKTVTITNLLKSKLRCTNSLVVVPYLEGLEVGEALGKVPLVSISSLATQLKLDL